MSVKAAILGYGRNGSTMHADAMERHPEIEVVAVCDIDPARRQQAADRFGCQVFEDYQEMLAKTKLDLVTIVTRSDQHCQMTCDCLQAGANVLVTKPWALNTAEANMMVQSARESGTTLYPWLPSRWGTWLRRLKTLLDEKVVGDVFLVRRINSSFGTRSDWQTEKRYGGGYLLNWGPHIVDPPLVLMGQKVTSAFGCLRQVINPGDVEDMFMAVLTLENGCLVQAEHTVATGSLPDWVIQGTCGTIIVRNRELTIHQGKIPEPEDPTKYLSMAAGGAKVITEEVTGQLYGSEDEVYADLVAALQKKEPFPVSDDDALYLTEVLDAIRQSSETNKVVQL